jgi:hypothetical protein
LNAGITDAGHNVGRAIFVAGLGDPGRAAFKERRLPSRRLSKNGCLETAAPCLFHSFPNPQVKTNTGGMVVILKLDGDLFC